jgi:transcriptional regulator with XRE-family HTH domain
VSIHPIAARVFAVADALGWTVADIAKALGQPHATVLKWRNGATPGGDALSRLPAVLKVNGHWLLTGEGPMAAPGARPDLALERAAAVAGFASVVQETVSQAIRDAIERSGVEPLSQEGLAAVQEVTEGLPTQPAKQGKRKAGG